MHIPIDTKGALDCAGIMQQLLDFRRKPHDPKMPIPDPAKTDKALATVIKAIKQGAEGEGG